MTQLRTLTKKCIKALNVKGCLMMIDHQSVYVKNIGRVIVKHSLKYLQPTAIYNYLHPDNQKNEEYDFVTVEVADSFRDIDILRELVAWLKDESEVKDKITKGIPLQLRTSLQLEGWLKDHPELSESLDMAIEEDVAERKNNKSKRKGWSKRWRK